MSYDLNPTQSAEVATCDAALNGAIARAEAAVALLDAAGMNFTASDANCALRGLRKIRAEVAPLGRAISWRLWDSYYGPALDAACRSADRYARPLQAAA